MSILILLLITTNRGDKLTVLLELSVLSKFNVCPNKWRWVVFCLPMRWISQRCRKIHRCTEIKVWHTGSSVETMVKSVLKEIIYSNMILFVVVVNDEWSFPDGNVAKRHPEICVGLQTRHRFEQEDADRTMIDPDVNEAACKTYRYLFWVHDNDKFINE